MNNACPGCGMVYSVSPQDVGRQFPCTKCGTPIMVTAEGLERGTGPVGYDPSQPYAPVAAPAGPSPMNDYLTFKKMLVPIIIQGIFWLGLAACIVLALVTIFDKRDPGGGLVLLFVGPVLVRVFCELTIIVFKMNETLTDIKNLLEQRKAEDKEAGAVRPENL